MILIGNYIKFAKSVNVQIFVSSGGGLNNSCLEYGICLNPTTSTVTF